MSFQGLRVVAFESRRATEIAELIRRKQGDPFVAPSMRELPLEDNYEAFAFAEQLFAGKFDMMILLTGVGTRALNGALATRFPEPKFAEALRRLAVVARGPKPAAVLREMQVPIAVMVPEPNTWRELLAATADRPERNIAVQEYGKSNPELLDGLRYRGANVTTVRIYRWDLPADTAPLREAAHRIARGDADVTIFTTSIQIAHLARIAAEEGIERHVLSNLNRTVVASIGPTTTESLEEFGIHPDLEPTHPKMGFLISETAEKSGPLLAAKRA
jgi:uroporphyrinogen-III synthase